MEKRSRNTLIIIIRDSMLNSKHTLYCTQICCAADVHVILHIQVHSSAGTGMFHCRDRYVVLERQVCSTVETVY